MITLPQPPTRTGKPAADAAREGPLPEIARRIGQTPLLNLTNLAGDLPETVSVYAKAEYLNPGGSVKDRAALRMIQEGLRTGVFRPGQTLLDATSGNTGIAYAMLGAAWGFPVRLAMPANASEARKQILEVYGADLVLTDPMDGTDGAQRFVRDLIQQDPDRYFYPDQYNNEANWRAHFDGTAGEIIKQTFGRVTHFVAVLGTTGTFTGVSRRLKAHDPSIRRFSVQPDSPLHGMEGVKHLETAIVPGIYDPSLVDEALTVTTEEAFAMTRRLAREAGLLVGISSGANVATALRVARSLDEGTVVTIRAGHVSRRVLRLPARPRHAGRQPRRHDGARGQPAGLESRASLHDCAIRLSRCRRRRAAPGARRRGLLPFAPGPSGSSFGHRPGRSHVSRLHLRHRVRPRRQTGHHHGLVARPGPHALRTGIHRPDTNQHPYTMTTISQQNIRTTIHVPTPLRKYTDGQASVEVAGATVGQALNDLADRYSALRTHLYDDAGHLRSFINVYLNDEDIRYLDKENTSLGEGDTLSIIPSIAGGWC